MLWPKLQVGAAKKKSIGLMFFPKVRPGMWTLILQHLSSGVEVLRVPVKLGRPMFRYLVIFVRRRPKGMVSSGWVNRVMAVDIYIFKREELDLNRQGNENNEK